MITSVTTHLKLLAFWSPGPSEMLLLAAVALLLYGGKLPEVARSWGKSLAEFRRGLSGIQSEINDAIYSTPERLDYYPEARSYESYESESAVEPEGSETNLPDDASDASSETLPAGQSTMGTLSSEESSTEKRSVAESD